MIIILLIILIKKSLKIKKKKKKENLELVLVVLILVGHFQIIRAGINDLSLWNVLEYIIEEFFKK